MGLYAKQPESNIEPIPADTYQAVCYGVVDIGTHYNEIYDVKQHKIVLMWELPELKIDFEKDGQRQSMNRTISKQYTLSLSEKSNLYKDLLSWRGVPFTPAELEGFDVRKVTGVNCLLAVINEPTKDGEKIRAKIASISKLMKNMPALASERALITYSLEDDGIGHLPDGLPDWLRDKIQNSLEYQAVTHAKDSGHFDEEEPPVQNNSEWVGDNPTPIAEGDPIPF